MYAPGATVTQLLADTPDQMGRLLQSYPRTRPPLPAAHERIHLDEYRRNRSAAGGALFRVTAALEAWMHRRVAADSGSGDILELGAGTLNHLPYEAPHSPYDIVEPWTELYKAHPSFGRIRRRYRDVADVPADSRYGRIISVAVLEHLEDLPQVVARSGCLLADGGAFQAGIPAEGGMLWGLSWRLTTGIAYRLRNGLPYAPVMRHEHLNTAAEIIAVVRYFFRSADVAWFPLPFPQLSFYAHIAARDPHLPRCESFLQKHRNVTLRAAQRQAGMAA